MSKKIIKLNKEFDKFWQKIEKKENFALLRYGDGERLIMLGKSVKAQEGWTSPDYMTKLGENLNQSLNIENDKVFYGISCPCCDNAAYYWYMTRIKNKNKTFANLFVNCNYQKFIEKFGALKRDAILIANFRAEDKKIGNLNILKHYKINDDCISFWENEAPEMIEQIKKDFGQQKDLLYVVSAGPMSEVIIENLFKNNHQNCYIDFGSAIDEYYYKNITRPYMKKNNEYAKRNCWMDNPQTTDFDVSVVLNLYKRPENLELQLNSIQNQTLKPKEILLYQDGTENGTVVKMPENLKSKFNLIKINEKNCGVWERFKLAHKANSKYICVFDDDTIPGERWLENCLSNMLKREGLYGTIGILLEKPEVYPNGGYFRIGWEGNLNKTLGVDFVGHSWFFKKDWIKYLLDGTEEFQNLKTVAEDMCFSAQLQKHEIKTYVPPHPSKNTALWGSLPEYAFKLGITECAISENKIYMEKMNVAINKLLNKGWKPLIYRNPLYVKMIKYKLLYNEQKPISKTKFIWSRIKHIFG